MEQLFSEISDRRDVVESYVKMLEDHDMHLATFKHAVKTFGLAAGDSLRRVGIVKEGHVQKILIAIKNLDTAAPQ